MAGPGRPGRDPGCPKIPGSGKKPGTPSPRIISEKVKGDLLAVYRSLGGRKWLLSYAREHGEDFLRHLMRLVPAEPLVQVNAEVNTQINQLSEHEVAVRIAYVLSKVEIENRPAEPVIRTLEHQPEPVPVDATPTLPPSSPPLPDDQPPTGLVYPGSAMEQDRLPRTKRVMTKRGRSLL